MYSGWLTGNEIARQRDLGRICISPFSASLVNPNSYNYRLGRLVRRLVSPVIDMKSDDMYELTTLNDEGFTLFPGECYLCHTEEVFGSDFYAALVTGRRSIGRKFITNHITAGLIDIGFFGQITLEVTVQRPTIVYPGIPFGQIFWFTVSGELGPRYDGKYQHQMGPTSSRLSTEPHQLVRSRPKELSK